MIGSIGKWIARGLALAGLVVVGLIAYNLVSTSVDDIREDSDEPGATTETEGCKPEDKDAVSDGFYIVREDDLISVIAERTCVDQVEILRLNDGLDPQTLTPGQCVNLRERGCENLK